MKGFIQEFKKFALRGNVMDLAVGVIIGGAFGKIVTALVNDIFTPFLGYLTGNINLGDLKIWSFNIGDLIQTTIDFIIIAFVIFLMVKVVNHFKRKEETKQNPEVPKEEKLLTEIRDILKEIEGKNK